MSTRVLRFSLHGYWHPGSGRGDGAQADAAVNRDRHGLPSLPGRTVKGLVREAARLGAAVNLLTAEQVVVLFGSELPPVTADDRVRPLEEARHRTEPGLLRFDSARLGRGPVEQAAWRAWALANPEACQGLYSRFASTAVGADGLADDHTLRAIELVVPVELFASVEGPDDAPWDALDQAVRLFLRGVGSHRNRGLGRATVALEVP